MKLLLVAVVVFLIAVKENFYNEAAIMRFTNMICESDNTIYIQHTCRIKAVQRHRTVLDFNGTLLRPVYDMKARWQALKKANGFKPWLYDFTFDVCEFLKKRNNPVINIAYNTLKDRSNINHTCPFVGPVLIKDMYFIPDLFPLPMPTGEYRIAINWTFNRVSKLYTIFQFEFIEDLTAKS